MYCVGWERLTRYLLSEDRAIAVIDAACPVSVLSFSFLLMIPTFFFSLVHPTKTFNELFAINDAIIDYIFSLKTLYLKAF